MALIEQWRSKRSIAVDGVIALAAGVLSIGALVPAMVPPTAQGTLSAPRENWENPVRARIMSTLNRSPGIHFRELQRRLDAANGTLRHHLDVLVAEKSVTTMSVNGRTCYYAGAPAQVEILIGTGVTDDARAASMLPVGLSELQQAVVARLTRSDSPRSQAALARDLGRSRSAVHSALGVLRTRGIVAEGELRLADHLSGLKTSKFEYNWLDLRAEMA
jgi:DNA-binding transcriptional ArsR family regulator